IEELDVETAGHLRGGQSLVRERPKPGSTRRQLEFLIPEILDDARKAVAKSKPFPIFPSGEIIYRAAVIVEIAVSIRIRALQVGDLDPRRWLTANELNPVAQSEIEVLLIHPIQHGVATIAGVDHLELHRNLPSALGRTVVIRVREFAEPRSFGEVALD